MWQPGVVSSLSGALASDVAPSLRVLDLGLRFEETTEEDLGALATMLETRAQRPACRSLEEVTQGFLECSEDILSEEGRCQLLRAMLRSVVEIDKILWDAAYEACFVEIQPPRVKRWWVGLDGGTNEATPSVQMLEAMPELECLCLTSYDYATLQHLQPVISALQRGVVLQRLQSIEIGYFRLAAEEWGQALRALAGATCAMQLTHLELADCHLCPVSMATFSELLGQDSFPMLQDLNLNSNRSIGDEGVATLVRGLLEAKSRTRLTHLNLGSVEMGDGGFAALTSLVLAGRFERAEEILLGDDWKDSFDRKDSFATYDGLCEFARALEVAGKGALPMLRKFRASYLRRVTSKGIGAFALALINNCPRLTEVDLSGRNNKVGSNQTLKEVVEGMIHAAGCRHRLKFRL